MQNEQAIGKRSIFKTDTKSLIGAVTVVIGVNLMPFILSYVKIGAETNMWRVGIALFTTIPTRIINPSIVKTSSG